VLDEHFPGSRPTFVLLVTSPRSVDDTAVARTGIDLTRSLADEAGVSGVASYWTTGLDALRSRDGHAALVVAHLDGDEAASARTEERLAPLFRGRHDDVDVRIGGSAAVLSDIESTIAEDLRRSEVIALPVTLLVLVLVFGSAVAALLPLLVAALAISGTNAVLWLLAGATDVSVFAQNLTTALGLGLAIDYALLVIRRFREELSAGREPAEAARAVLRTAGRTVAFSALTVSIALAVMLLFPLYFLRSFAYAGISVVLLAAAATLLVLPAVLMLLGRRVDAWDLRVPLRRVLRRGRRNRVSTAEGARTRRFVELVLRRAPVAAVVSLGVLLVAGLPVLHVQFGTADERQLPTTAESRIVSDTVRDRFPSSSSGAVSVVATVPDAPSGTTELETYARHLSELPGAGEVQTPIGTFADGRPSRARTPLDALRRSGDLAFLQVEATGQVEDVSARSAALVRAVRAVEAPFPTLSTSPAAGLLDTQEAISSRLALALGLVVVTTLILVFLLTGSVVLPLVAVALNALSLVVMFGAAVWVFQDGHLSGQLGFTPTGFIDTSLPVLMFCLAFGLSMDYGLFVLARITEEHDHSRDPRRAVVVGLTRTGTTITAAAFILAIVMVAIGQSRITNTMMLGWGAALAVLADATLVRGMLLPAVLGLLGRSAWWAPAPLRRLHQRVGLRETSTALPPQIPSPRGDTHAVGTAPATGPTLPPASTVGVPSP